MKTMASMLRWLAAVQFVLVALSLVVPAQNNQYKPGDKIEYKVRGSYPEVWEVGTFVGTTSDGSQPIIREKPNEFYKDGFQRAVTWDSIRPIAARPKPPANPNRDAPPDNPRPERPGDLKPARPDDNPVTARCDRPLTQEDILSFLRNRLGNDPFRDPNKKEKTEMELAALIRQCGVNFRYDPISKFGNDLKKFGAGTAVTYPIMANFGAPARQEWYTGTWNTSVTSVARNLLDVTIAAKTGFLTINANGTYVWKLYPGDPPARYVRGSWRAATAAEMAVSYQGGAGIVLLKGKEGYDWLVRQDRETTLAGDWIEIANLNYRQQREAGKRR